MSAPSDRTRAVAVLVLAVLQVVSSPLTTLALGPSSNTGAISDAYISPVTPAGYAFAIWGLIYAASLAYAVYQLTPGQRDREVHRRTGWWLVAAFSASTLWVPVFGSRTIWLSQIIIVALVGFLVVATVRAMRTGPAAGAAERLLFRLPVTLYLGWATLATAAGFGLTFRSVGMPKQAGWVTVVSLLIVAVATVASVLVVSRLSAVAGFAFTSCWALVAVAVATYVEVVRVGALVALVVVLAAVLLRARRDRRPTVALLG